jgi:hypothetical protein
MRVEWRPRTPRSTRRLATRPSSPQALVTVDRCGQQARRAAGCASECRDSRVYMSWCLRPIMTWHIPAIGSKISGSRFPLCRRGVNFPRSPKQAWHMRVFRQSERYGHDSLPARTDQRDQGSLRLHPPSSLGAATNEASTASLRERRVRALSFPSARSGPCAMTCLLRRVPPQVTSRREQKQSRRAEPKQNNAPAATHGQLPARGAWREDDTLPYAVGRQACSSTLQRHKRHSAYAAGWQRYVLRHHFVTPRIIGGVVCRSTRAHLLLPHVKRASFTAAVSPGKYVAAAVQSNVPWEVRYFVYMYVYACVYSKVTPFGVSSS